MKIKYTFTIPDIWGAEEREEFESKWDGTDLNWVAEDAAEHYHSNCDGWEHKSWPIELYLYDEDGANLLGKFSVDREAQPVFMARKIKQ